MEGLKITNTEYYANTSRVSKSHLDWLDKTPAHYKAKYIDKLIDDEQTPAMALGSAVHSAILEPDLFESEYAISPECDKRTKEGKAIYEQFLATSEGKTIISAKDYELCQRLKDSVYGHSMARSLLEKDGYVENTYFFTDNETGIECKCRPDKLIENIVLDLKTTSDASPEGFGKSVWNFKYDKQGTFYTDGLMSKGINIDAFIFIAVETTPPYLVALYYLTTGQLEIGRDKYLNNLRILKTCRESGIWEGYGNTIIEVQLPMWALKSL